MLESARRTPSVSRPARVLLDREQGEAVVRLRGDQDDVGRRALHDELLAARQLEAVAGALGAHLDRVRPVLRPFVDRQRRDRLAGEDAGKPALA